MSTRANNRRRPVRSACRHSVIRVRRHAFGEQSYGLAAATLVLLTACAEPQPDPITGPGVVTEEAIDPLPEGPLDALAVGQRYDDVDDLVLAAAPMAPGVEVLAEEQPDGSLLVQIEATGFEDDALEGQRFDVTTTRGSNGLTVTAIDQMNLCYRDGSDEWTKELCP